MIYGSVSSGIEAATVAWRTIGWKPAFFSEIEKFPNAVLAHHYPDVPNLGDMTKFKEWPNANIDVLVGGTPCQSFSVAGLRKGLDDPRGNLMLTYLAIVKRYRPQWVVWENVPGVLSSSGGRDFGTFLGALGQLGYGFAYRVLDAQYFGVAQRRRRVFVVGCIGDWRAAAAVLFERESLSGDSAPSREKRQDASKATAKSFGIRSANTSSNGWGVSEECTHTLDQASPHIAAALTANGVGTCGADDNQGQAGHLVAAYGGGNCSGHIDIATTPTAHGTRQCFEGETFIDHTLRGEGFDASEDGTGRGTPLVPCIAFNSKDHGTNASVEISPTLRASGHDKSHANAGAPPAVAVSLRGRDGGATAEIGDEISPTLRCGGGGGDKPHVLTETADTITSHWHNSNGAKAGNKAGSLDPMINRMAVRRLTPIECERLQGFPDNYTRIPWRGKESENCPDGLRYRSIGNSMAVPVMRWIGERIEMVDRIIKETAT